MYPDSFKKNVLTAYYRLKKLQEKDFTIKSFIEDVFKIDISTVYKWIKEDKKNHLEIYKNHSITPEIITYIKFLIGNKKRINAKEIKKDINSYFNKSFNLNTIHFILKNEKIEYNNFKINKEIENFILQKYLEDKTTTANQVKLLIKSNFKINICTSSIYNILKKNNFTYKNVYVKTNHYTTEEQILQLKKVKEELDTLNVSNIVSFDEMCVVNNENPTKGWSKSGDKCIIEENKTLYSKRFTVGLMITPEKALHFKIVENGMKTEDFMDIVKEYNKESNINNDKTLFLDNASIHKTKTFINYMDETKMKVLYNVPYHSDKNPIEYIFSMLRKTIQRETFSTLEDLESIVRCFCFMIESEKIKKCFNHAFSLFSKTIEKLENRIK